MAGKTTTTQERIARVGQGRQVVIPREILGTLKIQKGDFSGDQEATERRAD